MPTLIFEKFTNINSGKAVTLAAQAAISESASQFERH